MAISSSGVPLRKRIGRACDQCRRRKTKCDGELKCKTCIDVKLECSYGYRIRQARGPSYVAHLEKKLRDLEKQLHTTTVTSTPSEDELPGLDAETSPANSSFSGLIQLEPRNSSSFEQSAIDPFDPIELSPAEKLADDLVETIDSAYGYETDFGNETRLVYRGRSTGVEILRNLHRLCNSFAGLTVDSDSSATKMANALDRSFPIHYLSLDSMSNVCLPEESQVHRWIDLAFTKAFTLWPFIDRQLFNFHVQRLLGQKNFGREKGDKDNLALIHAVLSLGQRYDPDLIKDGGDCFESGEVRGIKHFGAARDLVGLTECSRSVTSVQTVLCMCIYLKSVAAQRMVHTYVSMAGHAAYVNPTEPPLLGWFDHARMSLQMQLKLSETSSYGNNQTTRPNSRSRRSADSLHQHRHQLGLHAALSARHLPERERVIRQRVYIAIRIMDGYITSSLGLPRNFRAIDAARDAKNACFENLPESFLAADANVELLEILGATVDKAYFTNAITQGYGSTAIQYEEFRKVPRKLEKWGRKYPVFAQTTDDNLATCTRTQLLLRYSKCWVLLILYSPFMHHVAKPIESRSPNAYACASNCVAAAIQAVRTAEALDIRGIFDEAYPLTVDVLAMAAITLLVVELGAPNDFTADTVRRTSRNAKVLLKGLAQRNSTAAQCLESLTPLYEKLTKSALSATVTIEEVMQDFTLFTTENSEVPVFNTSLDPFDPNLFVEPPPKDMIDTFNYPTI